MTSNESVASLPVRIESPVVDDFTAKVATPFAFDVPERVVMVSTVEPLLEERVTVLLGTRLPLASFSVTVTVEVALPSAATLAEFTETVDLPAVGVSGVKVTTAV